MPRLPCAVTCVLLGVAGVARAEPAPAEPPIAPPADRKKTEFNIVPIAGGNSDVGVGIGQLSNLSGIKQGVEPFRWQLETSAFVTFKPQDGSLIVPFQDYWLAFHLPNLGHDYARIDARVSFTDESTLAFYGIGNASHQPRGVPDVDTQYERIHPTLWVRGRAHLYRDFYITGGSVYTYNRLHVAPTTVLGQYPTAGPADAKPFVGSFANHSVELLELGLQYDTRDHEIDTRSGQYHAIQLRVSPRVGTVLPYRYERVTLTTRYYYAVTEQITLTARLVGDVLVGDPPFYELARYDETSAIGGANAVRGVPATRYYGNVKLFGNVEARSDLVEFHIGGKPLKLGVAVFFDGGRTWTELWHSHPDLDGTGIGLKYGVGGGLRLQQGATFVVRADLAYSPDAKPVGAYFTAGQIF